jgi:hypothetical protein
MSYSTPPHVPSPEDRTIIRCRCGWISGEMTRDQLRERGVPWWCDRCDGIATYFVTFAPNERRLLDSNKSD